MLFKKYYKWAHQWTKDNNSVYFDIEVSSRNQQTLMKLYRKDEHHRRHFKKTISVIKMIREDTNDDGLEISIEDFADNLFTSGIIEPNRKMSKEIYDDTDKQLAYIKNIILKYGYEWKNITGKYYIQMKMSNKRYDDKGRTFMSIKLTENDSHKRYFNLAIFHIDKNGHINKGADYFGIDLVYNDLKTIFEPIISFWERSTGKELVYQE